jgi:hypothetical protein
MLPASDLTEILTNLAALKLQPNTVSQILAAVLAPLMRSSGSPELEDLQGDPKRPHKRVRAGRPRSRGASRRRKYQRRAPMEARDRAIAAFRANPDATPTEIAKIGKVSRSTAVNARKDLAAEARKDARRKSRESKPSKTAHEPKTDRRQRAQQFLLNELAHGPKRVSDVEEAAAKAHVELHVLEQARADLGILTTRATGGAQAVQWALPG